MSEVVTLKAENEALKNQLVQNGKGVQNLLTQIDALKGELTDARTISLQLRINLVTAQQAGKICQEQCINLQKEIDELKESKSAEIPPLKEVNKGK